MQRNVIAAAGPRSPPLLRGGLFLSKCGNPDLDAALSFVIHGRSAQDGALPPPGGVQGRSQGPSPRDGVLPRFQSQEGNGGPEQGAGKAQGTSGLTLPL